LKNTIFTGDRGVALSGNDVIRKKILKVLFQFNVLFIADVKNFQSSLSFAEKKYISVNGKAMG
jgi:hypothetical protein